MSAIRSFPTTTLVVPSGVVPPCCQTRTVWLAMTVPVVSFKTSPTSTECSVQGTLSASGALFTTAFTVPTKIELEYPASTRGSARSTGYVAAILFVVAAGPAAALAVLVEDFDDAPSLVPLSESPHALRASDAPIPTATNLDIRLISRCSDKCDSPTSSGPDSTVSSSNDTNTSGDDIEQRRKQEAVDSPERQSHLHREADHGQLQQSW